MVIFSYLENFIHLIGLNSIFLLSPLPFYKPQINTYLFTYIWLDLERLRMYNILDFEIQLLIIFKTIIIFKNF